MGFESEWDLNRSGILIGFDRIMGVTPGPFTVEVRMDKPVGLHGSRLRPIPGEKVKLGYRASKCRKTDRESLTWK